MAKGIPEGWHSVQMRLGDSLVMVSGVGPRNAVEDCNGYRLCFGHDTET